MLNRLKHFLSGICFCDGSHKPSPSENDAPIAILKNEKYSVHTEPFFFHEDLEYLKEIFLGDQSSIKNAMPNSSKDAIPISACGIKLDDLEEQLPLTEKYTSVVTGTYSSRLEMTPFIAYAGDCFTLFCLIDNSIVTAIWLDYGFIDKTDNELFFSTLKSIGSFGDLLLVDWTWDQVIRINDDDDLSEFANFMQDKLDSQ